MSALQYLTASLFCIAATAGTYLTMHGVVAPRLPVAAVEVPSLSGLTIEQARALCDPRGLLLVIDGAQVPETPRGEPVPAPGTLFGQHPLAGSRLQRGDRVHAQLAKKVPLKVPAVVGLTADAAAALLKERGLLRGAIAEVASEQPAGQVIASRPEPGTEVARGESVELSVSKGSEAVMVPSVRGRGLRSAQKALEAAGLQLGEVRYGVDDNAGDGVVLRQDPAQGTMAPKGQKINLVVNE